jgi:hypothetical protein
LCGLVEDFSAFDWSGRCSVGFGCAVVSAKEMSKQRTAAELDSMTEFCQRQSQMSLDLCARLDYMLAMRKMISSLIVY